MCIRDRLAFAEQGGPRHTEVLAERGILKAREAGEGARVLDLCAGSGCVGLAVAANAPNCRVVLAELSEGALRLCKQNVRRNDLNSGVTCLSVNAREPPSSCLLYTSRCV